ncbi:unnamed protein product, partial [Musa hybrid cultivar]
ECKTRSCGEVKNITHPFWLSGEKSPGSPGFEVECEDNRLPVLVNSFGMSYSVHQIFYDNRSLWLNNTKLAADYCPVPSDNVQFGPDDCFSISTANRELFLFHHCAGTRPENSTTTKCAHDDVYAKLGGNYGDFPPPDLSCGCEVLVRAPVYIPGGEEESTDRCVDLLKNGFLVEWWEEKERCGDCRSNGWKCGSDHETGEFVFIYVYGYLAAPPGNDSGNHRKQIIIGVCVGVGCLAALSFLCLVYVCRRKRPQPSASSVLLARPVASSDPESGIEQYHTQVFTYEELEAATDGFSASNKLGDGGFGAVYKGKLLDGRTVAIKRFYRNNYRLVEQFVNEAYILSSLRHQNLVVLYGCTSRHSRQLILVYEYVPNGTVADHLHGPRAREAALAWPLRMRVAIETADALSYLHATTPQIIHRDVKTSNILLDVGFHVKVADFGLSRLFPANATHVSTAPQGTPGYVDPDYHECFQLTDKSDVYSFGVVLAELISSKPAVDVTRQRHDINLATMAISKIQNQELEQLVDPTLWCQSKGETRTMIEQVAEVAFRCLQAETEIRPTMKEVLEALKAIQDEGCSRAKGVEADAAANDEDCLLGKKSSQSPDTVTANWESRSTTPHGSG